jgi:glycosyltransferase involved in cell wall biosynthesis
VRLAVVHPEIEWMDEYHGGAIARWTAEVFRRAPADVDATVFSMPARRAPYRGVRARLVAMRSAVFDRFRLTRPRAIHPFFRELRARLLRGRFDAIHVHARPQWVAPLRAAGIDAPIVLHLQNDHLGSWPAADVEALMRDVTLCLGCSDFIVRRTRGTDPTTDRPGGAIGDAAASRVRTLYNGVDVERFTPAVPPRDPSGGMRIAYLGRIVPDKAPHLTMKAVIALRREGRPVSMCLIGAHDFGRGAATPYLESLRVLASQDPAAFRFFGYVHHARLPRALRTCDAYVHSCTWHEPFALATAEAMACGLAPVVSRRGANLEVAGDDAPSFEPTDPPTELLDRLRPLLDSPTTLRGLQANARSRAAERFSWDGVATRYFALLSEALAGRVPAPGSSLT